MKTKYLLATLLFSILIYSSCNRDMIWDIVNHEFLIYATNSNGDNLFDPDVEENLLDGGIKIRYKDEVYEMINVDEPQTRYLPPRELALRYYPKGSKTYNGKLLDLVVGFGEFDPEQNYKGEEFTILWADGTSDKVKFDHYVKWSINNKPKLTLKVYLNGTKVDKLEFVK